MIVHFPSPRRSVGAPHALHRDPVNSLGGRQSGVGSFGDDEDVVSSLLEEDGQPARRHLRTADDRMIEGGEQRHARAARHDCTRGRMMRQ